MKAFKLVCKIVIAVSIGVAVLTGLVAGFSAHPWWTAAIVALVLAIVPACYYAVYGLAKADIIWTVVDQGWCKIISKWGEYSRTLRPGLRLIGIPGTRTLYKRKMTFLKSVTDKEGKPQAEPHEDEGISSFKTTRYPYALPFKDEEDDHGLPLSGILAAFCVIEDYRKAFFGASDWYAEMNTKILSCFRDILAKTSYDDDLVGRETAEEQTKPTFEVCLWEALNSRQNGNPSILDELLNVVGIRVYSVELRSVDPPADWRATTLAPYKAEREKAAAVNQAQVSATLLDDTNQALVAWRKEHLDASPDQIKEKQTELARRAYLKAGGQYQEIHGLENATTVAIGNSGLGILASPRGPKGGGQSPRGTPPAGASAPKMSDQEIAEEAFQRTGSYPSWWDSVNKKHK